MAPIPELRIRVPELPRVPTALIRILAEAEIGGSRMDQMLSGAIHVQCVGCGIRLPITELMGLRSSPSEDSSQKIDRLRLGYCARHSCSSQFYSLSVGQDVELDRQLILDRLVAEIANAKAEPGELTFDEGRLRENPFADLMKKVGLRVGSATLLVLVFIWWRAGAYIPGVSKKPQVFMPVEDVSPHSPTELDSKVSVRPPPRSTSGNLNGPDRAK